MINFCFSMKLFNCWPFIIVCYFCVFWWAYYIFRQLSNFVVLSVVAVFFVIFERFYNSINYNKSEIQVIVSSLTSFSRSSLYSTSSEIYHCFIVDFIFKIFSIFNIFRNISLFHRWLHFQDLLYVQHLVFNICSIIFNISFSTSALQNRADSKNKVNNKTKIYLKLAAITFKGGFGNHKEDINHRQLSRNTELPIPRYGH